MAYQLLLADADGTLFDFDHTEDQALRATFETFNIDDTQENRDLYQKINKKLWEDYEKGQVTQRDIEDTRFEQLYKALMGKAGFGIEIEAHYVLHLAKGNRLLTGARAFINEVSQIMPVEIVTNGITYVQKERLRRSAIAGQISGVWISEEVGHAKPNPKMVEMAMDKYKIDKSKVVLLGDSLKADVGAANAAGIDSIWLTSQQEKNPKATYQVSSLEEAKEILFKSYR